MKNLLLCALGAVSLLAVQSASAIIYARQVWEHKYNPAKKVEIFFDTHATYFLGGQGKGSIDQKDLVLSNKLYEVASQQKKDIVWSAMGHGPNVHVWVEDQYLFMMLKPFSYSMHDQEHNKKMKIARYAMQKTHFLIGKIVKNVCVLDGLIGGLRQAKVPCTNIEFRDGGDYTGIEKEVASYNDGVPLNNFYASLDKLTKGFGKNARADDYLFNAQLIHRVAHCDAQHQIVVVGGLHGDALAAALPLMGYRLQKSMNVHPTVQKIMHAAESDVSGLESIVKEHANLWLKTKNVEEYCKAQVNFIAEADGTLTAAFLMTHPIDIRTIVEQERKEAAANRATMTATSPLPSAPAVALTPRVEAVALASALVMPTLRARL